MPTCGGHFQIHLFIPGLVHKRMSWEHERAFSTSYLLSHLHYSKTFSTACPWLWDSCLKLCSSITQHTLLSIHILISKTWGCCILIANPPPVYFPDCYCRKLGLSHIQPESQLSFLTSTCATTVYTPATHNILDTSVRVVLLKYKFSLVIRPIKMSVFPDSFL